MRRFGTALRRTVIGCVLGICFSSTVAAEPILRSTFRHLFGSAEVSSDFSFVSTELGDSTFGARLFDVTLTDEVTDPPFAFFFVTQKTDISATRWFGSGTARAFASSEDETAFAVANAGSVMEVEFRLTEPMSYRFTGTASGYSFIFFGGPGIFWSIEGNDGVPQVATRSGLLSAGDYSFRAETSALTSASTGGAFDLDFTLDPVPEPATLLLFATGAAAIGRRAWRRRNRADVDATEG